EYVERRDTEAAGGVVEHPQTQQIAEIEAVVGNRLARDENAVLSCSQPVEHLPCAAAEEVRVAQTGSARQRRRVDAERVLESRSDIRVGGAMPNVACKSGPTYAKE